MPPLGPLKLKRRPGGLLGHKPGELICEHRQEPDTERYTSATVQQAAMRNSSGKLLFKIPLVDLGGKISQQGYRWYKVFATLRGSRNIYGLLLV